MGKNKISIFRVLTAFIGIIIDFVLGYQAFFADNSNGIKLIYFLFLELTLSINMFLFYISIVGMEKGLDVFFKNQKTSMLWFLMFINFDLLVASIVFAILLNWIFAFGVLLPVLYVIALIALYVYCNRDSESIKNSFSSKYLGVGVNGHFVFDGIDVLADKNKKPIKFDKFQIVNPFNQIHSFLADEIFYVSGNDYKFYIATHKMNDLYTLIFLARNKDAVRYRLNKRTKEDFELNKNIYLAYALENTEKDESYTYFQDKLRYCITDIPQNKSIVKIEQKTELPHLTSENQISNWFGDSFTFDSRAEADNFVKFVVEQTKNGALDEKI